jgi:flagellar hook assembly protein FlgD
VGGEETAAASIALAGRTSRARRRLCLLTLAWLVCVAAGAILASAASAAELTVSELSSDRYFSPNGDGQEDAISRSYYLSGTAKVTVTIRDSKGSLVRTVQGNVTESPGWYSFSWDGTKENGKAAGNGVYTYTISASSTSEGAASASGRIGIDTEAPGVIKTPKSGQTVSGTTAFSLQPSSSESVESVEFRAHCADYYWYSYESCLLGTAMTPELEGAFGITADVSELTAGTNKLAAYVAYSDPFGEYHNETVSLPMTVSTSEKITNVSSESYFTPNGDGQDDTGSVSYFLYSTAKVTTTIKNSASEVIKTLASGQEQGYGYNSFEWDGTTQAGKAAPNGLYTYTISTNDGYGSPALVTGKIGVDREAPGTLSTPKANEAISGKQRFVFKPSSVESVEEVSFYSRCARGDGSWYWCQVAQSTVAEKNGTFVASGDVSRLIEGSNEIEVDIHYQDPLGAHHSEWLAIPVAAAAPENVEDDTADRYFGDDQEPETSVSYFLTSPGKVTITIKNAAGETVKTALSEEQAYGSNRFSWDGSNSADKPAPEGVYTYTVSATDSYGSASVSGHLGLDRRTPARLSAPSAGAHIEGSVELEAVLVSGDTATSAYFYGTCARYGSECGFASSSSPSSASAISASGEVDALTAGTNELHAEVGYTDPFGQQHSYWTGGVPVTAVEAVPVDSEAPSISGTTQEGNNLYADVGQWSESPTEYAYQWLRCNAGGGACAEVEGASRYYYSLTSADVGHTLRVRVTAENTVGPGQPAQSVPSSVVGSAPGSVVGSAPEPPEVLHSGERPVVTGSPQRGHTLADTGVQWTNEPTSYSYQWLRCRAKGVECEAIAGARGRTYTISPADVGYAFEARETASNAGGTSQPVTSAPTAVATVSSLRADAGEAISATAGRAVKLDGSGSTPAESITHYRWEFGDGTNGEGAILSHTYEQPGKYTATLTVTDGTSYATDSIAIVIAAPAPEVSITTQDENGNALAGTEVLYIAPDGKRTSVASDEHGIAGLAGLPDGEDTLYVYKEGFKPGVAHVSVAGGHGESTVKLISGQVATSTLDEHQMDLNEIEAAGINTSDPANQNVYEFEVRLAFIKSPVYLHCYMNGEGEFVGSCDGREGGEEEWHCQPAECDLGEDGEGEGSGGFGEFEDAGGDSVSVVPKIINGHPLIEWLILRGKVSVLKQFASVSMTVQNLSEEPFKLTGGTATLTLPEGLSLAPTSTPQSFSQPVADIGGGASATTTWIVRGDEPGSYYMSAEYTGQLEPFEAPIDLHAATAEPMRIWGVEALDLSVKADSGKLYTGSPYHVTIGVTNEADVPLYNVDLAIDEEVHANFDFQPDGRFSDIVGELKPGQTFYSHHYILLPDAESADVFNPSLSSATFDGQEIYPGENIEEVAPPPIYALTAPTDTPGQVHLHWQPVPSAEGYEVFSTPDLDTAFDETPDPVASSPGGSLSTQVLSSTTTDAYLPASSGTRVYVVSALIEGRPTVESQAVEVNAVEGLPELGRCAAAQSEKEGKKTVSHGGYTDSKCTKASSSRTGKYEWTAGPGSSPTFTASGGKINLETVGRRLLSCTASSGSGTLAGGRSLSMALTLSGCELAKQYCQSEGASSGQIKFSATGELGFITGGAKPTVGLALTASSGNLFEATCGSSTVSLKGTVISPVASVDKINSSLSLKLKASRGKQTPQELEDGVKDTLGLTVLATPEEQAGLSSTITVNLAQPSEIKAID